MENIPITYVFPEEKSKYLDERMNAYNAMNYPIIVGDKYLCDIDWITYEMYTTTFHKSPAEEIGKFLKEKGYVDKIIKGEIKRKTLVFEIGKHLIDIQAQSGKDPDMDYAEKLHAYRLSPEYREWGKNQRRTAVETDIVLRIKGGRFRLSLEIFQKKYENHILQKGDVASPHIPQKRGGAVV